MALGFWGVGLPLAVFGILFCQTAAERVTVLVLAAVFLVVDHPSEKARVRLPDEVKASLLEDLLS